MGKVAVFRWARQPQCIVLVVAGVLALAGYMLRPVHAQQPVSQPGLPASVAGAKMIDCSRQACIALTFDDGPDPRTTPLVLDTLKRHNVRSTFFVMGKHVPGNEALLKRMHEEGHEIGNHSWSHPYFTQIPLESVREEIDRTQAAIIKAGVPAPHLFRPPYGDINDAVVSQIPLTVVRWNIDPADWHPRKQAHLVEYMTTHAKPGGMVVMHDTKPNTAEKLEPLIHQLKAQHYTFVTTSELLNVSPGQRGVFYGR